MMIDRTQETTPNQAIIVKMFNIAGLGLCCSYIPPPSARKIFSPRSANIKKKAPIRTPGASKLHMSANVGIQPRPTLQEFVVRHVDLGMLPKAAQKETAGLAAGGFTSRRLRS
jgi:hypothetical protein